MSASLHWKHAPKEPEEAEDTYLSHDLMFILRKRYWADGSPHSEERWITLALAGEYLKGLRDAKVEDADKLLQLLKDNPEGIIIYHAF